MDESQRDFSQRVSRVVKRHRVLGTAGYTARLRDDGLIVVQPRQLRFRLPLRGFVFLMTCFVAFKAFLLTYMGADAYQARLDILNSGTFGEAGAWIMGLDPVTLSLATLFSNLPL